VLIIAFLFGLMADVSSPKVSHPPPQPAIESKPVISPEDRQKAMELYLEGLDFLKNNEFGAAANSFQQSIELNSEYSFAQQELGKVLYRLGRYAGSVSATKEAIRLTNNPDLFFGLYYQMGLANHAQNELLYAKDDLMIAISFIQDGTRWEESHLHCYYLLAEVLQDLNDINAAITSLENDLRIGNGKPIQRFELANLYLRVGKIEAAKQQYRQLKTRNKSLAAALKKLMTKYKIQ
jgi:tetratricopeptide (TPR) repeat protein